MLALEPLIGQRIVASPATLDAAAWPSTVTVLRFAPDDAFVIGAETVGVSGEHVIVVDESGFVGAWLSADQLASVGRHIDWPLPSRRPALAQGYIAGVPAKLWFGDGEQTLLLCAAPYAADLAERLS